MSSTTLAAQTETKIKRRLRVRPVNWNDIQFPIDKEVWDRLTSNFWLDTKIPLSNDIDSWASLSPAERLLTQRVFAGLTALDTVQAEFGAPSLMKAAFSAHESEVYAYIGGQEAIHAKSYSSIFSTLCTSEEIAAVFDWADNNPYLQKKEDLVLSFYEGNDPMKRRIASTLLESFLFYSGFYLPFYFAARAQLTNTADLIRLIVRDEAVHGFYIGDRYQHGLTLETPERREELEDFTYTLLEELYENELDYTRDLYDTIGGGVTEDVSKFLRYNANKALMNLGYEALFPAETVDVNPEIITSLSLGSETHDFFSSNGSSYVMGEHEETLDEDWAWDDDDDAPTAEAAVDAVLSSRTLRA